MADPATMAAAVKGVKDGVDQAKQVAKFVNELRRIMEPFWGNAGCMSSKISYSSLIWRIVKDAGVCYLNDGGGTCGGRTAWYLYGIAKSCGAPWGARYALLESVFWAFGNGTRARAWRKKKLAWQAKHGKGAAAKKKKAEALAQAKAEAAAKKKARQEKARQAGRQAAVLINEVNQLLSSLPALEKAAGVDASGRPAEPKLVPAGIDTFKNHAIEYRARLMPYIAGLEARAAKRKEKAKSSGTMGKVMAAGLVGVGAVALVKRSQNKAEREAHRAPQRTIPQPA